MDDILTVSLIGVSAVLIIALVLSWFRASLKKSWRKVRRRRGH